MSPITHQYVSSAPPVPGKVDSTEWNREHTADIVNEDVNPSAGIEESKLNLNYPTHKPIHILSSDPVSPEDEEAWVLKEPVYDNAGYVSGFGGYIDIQSTLLGHTYQFSIRDETAGITIRTTMT